MGVVRLDAHASRGLRHQGANPNHEAKQRRRLGPLAICVCVFALCGAVLQGGSAWAAPHQWSVTQSPSKQDATLTYLNGVSCVSSSSCVAVGYYYNGSSYETLTESWDGAEWSFVPSPSPSTGYNYLYGVTCTSSTYCIAVGAYFDPPSAGLQTLVESWDGTEWSVVPSPNGSSSDNSLGSVSCVNPTNCVAVGDFDGGSSGPITQSLIESWNGSTWSIVSSPNPGSETNVLSGVSCTSRHNCMAVGYYIDTPNPMHLGPPLPAKTLVDSWNGSEWSVIHSPNPYPGLGGQLQGVSCTSATWCEAVGSDPIGPPSDMGALVETWSGSTWKAIPNFGTVLNGASCVYSSDCVAVGSAPSGHHQQTLIDDWNGSAEVHVSSPNARHNDGLGAVSCISATYCVAVGSATTLGGKPKSLIETGTS